LKIALYARVSTRDKGQNPEMQLEPMRKYCASMDYEITSEYIDKAESMDLTGRVEWTRMLKDAAIHKFDVLFIWKLDRAFRSNVHAANTLQTLNAYHIGFRSLMDPSIDTTTPNGMLIFNILASVAQFEKDLIVLRVNEGIRYAKEHGTKSGKPIGRKSYNIPFSNICKALQLCVGNYSEAARYLSKKYDKVISPGFVFSRIKRAGMTKDQALQISGDNSPAE
jgi:DNA invertase Pin-like site-specific DNA recombinase